MMRQPGLKGLKQKQSGAAAVEFALVAMVFMILLLGIVEMGRLLFTWNAAVEATRYGARVAAVCDVGDTAVISRMQLIMPNLQPANANIAYLPAGCTISNCQWVRVSVRGMQLTTLVPVVGRMFTVPPFTTTIPRESLDSVNSEGDANPLCD